MLAAPAGTPAPVIARLYKEMSGYVASPEGQKRLMDMGLTPGDATPPAELAKFVEREVVAWGKVVQKAGAAGIE
jgi:tripartite-type tricarboxylate transporter receptor subunit TctC